MPIVHRSPLPSVELTAEPITSFVLERAQELASQLPLVDGPGDWSLNYGELEHCTRSLAGGLRAEGFERGDVVALMAPNSPWYPVVFHAAATAAGAVTTINPTYGAEEIAFQLRDSAATRLFTTSDSIDAAREASRCAGLPGDVVVIDDDEPRDGVAMKSLLGDAIDQVDVHPNQDVVVLPYSSGTTGLPKGVMLTHANLVNNIEQSSTALVSQPGDVALAVLPFFHIYGMQVLMNDLLHNGATVVTMPRFDLLGALALIERHRVSRFFAVPPSSSLLRNTPPWMTSICRPSGRSSQARHPSAPSSPQRRATESAVRSFRATA